MRQNIELFLMNDYGQYFDLRLSPWGRYFGILYKDRGSVGLSHVPGRNYPVEVHNPCLDDDAKVIR